MISINWMTSYFNEIQIVRLMIPFQKGKSTAVLNLMSIFPKVLNIVDLGGKVEMNK